MQGIAQTINFIVSITLFFNVLLWFIQAVHLFRKKSSQGLSLATFTGFLLINLALTLHGFIIRDHILIYIYSLSSIANLIVLILIIKYKYLQHNKLHDLALQDIIDQLPCHIYWKDKHGVLLGSNRNNFQDFGLNDLKDFIGKTDYDLFSEVEANQLRQVDNAVIQQDKIMTVEEILTDKDNNKVVYLSNKKPLKNNKGEIVGLIGISVDITKSKEDINNQLTVLENIIAVMPGNVYWLNKEGVYLGCNDNEAKAVGLKHRNEIIGKRNEDLSGFVIPEAITPVNIEVMSTGKAITIEEPAILQDGREAVFLSSKVPLYDSKNNVVGLIGISFDITDRKGEEKELIAAKERAETANKAKTEFLANMQHDLRTPFSGILGFSEILKTEETDPKKKESLNYIAQSAKGLLDQINDIFEYIQSEHGTLPILKKQFDLHKIIQDVRNIMMPAALNKSLQFKLNCESDVPQFVRGDDTRLHRMLINLLSNAVKFTSHGEIEFSVSVAKKTSHEVIINFTIKDTGIGIPDDKQNIIFERFNRLTSAYSGVYVGKGLGLSMVKQFLEEITGEIHVKSKEGQGTTFVVLIPYEIPLLDCSI